jgi:cytochrome c2
MSAHKWQFFDPYDPDTRQCIGCHAKAEIGQEHIGPCPNTVVDEAAEAAALQRWLVANARHLRPVTSTGLTAWALAALQGFHLKGTSK